MLPTETNSDCSKMKTCQILISVSDNTKVAHLLSRDLISAATLQVDMLPGVELGRVLEIRERLIRATAAINDLECRLREVATFKPI